MLEPIFMSHPLLLCLVETPLKDRNAVLSFSIIPDRILKVWNWIPLPNGTLPVGCTQWNLLYRRIHVLYGPLHFHPLLWLPFHLLPPTRVISWSLQLSSSSGCMILVCYALHNMIICLCLHSCYACIQSLIVLNSS